MVTSLVIQIGRLEEKLANKEELIDLYIDNSFETQTQLAEREEEVERLKKEIQLDSRRNQEALTKLRDLEQTQLQLQSKETKLATMRARIHKLKEEAAVKHQSLQQRERT